MKSQILDYYNMTGLSNLGLVLFVSLFTAMLIWVFHSRRRPVYEHLANLPLEDDA